MFSHAFCLIQGSVSLQSHLSSTRPYQEGNATEPLLCVSLSSRYKEEDTMTSHGISTLASNDIFRFEYTIHMNLDLYRFHLGTYDHL